jgi:hypothetical protein
MRAHRLPVALLIPALVALFCATAQVYASPATDLKALVQRQPAPLGSRDGHSHLNTHTPPIVRLNETEHPPPPPSYWTIDIDSTDSSVARHLGLMVLHSLLMSLAFFIALPMGKYEPLTSIGLDSI